MQHLWEFEHPGYCEQGNPDLSPGDPEGHLVFSDWQDFLTNYADTPGVTSSANLLYRWDWEVPEEAEGYPEGIRPPDRLLLFIVNQRRGPFIFSAEVPVKPEDEHEVKEWLKERAKALKAIWAPILDRTLEEL